MTNAEAQFNKSHIRKVYACLAVTCHLHFWQNDRDFLRATVVTRGWNGYQNMSQHRKSTLEKKILPPFQQGFEPIVVTKDETLKYYCYGVMRKSVPNGTRFVAISTARCTTTHVWQSRDYPKTPLAVACNTRFFLKTGSRKITALLSNSQLWKLSIKIK